MLMGSYAGGVGEFTQSVFLDLIRFLGISIVLEVDCKEWTDKKNVMGYLRVASIQPADGKNQPGIKISRVTADKSNEW